MEEAQSFNLPLSGIASCALPEGLQAMRFTRTPSLRVICAFHFAWSKGVSLPVKWTMNVRTLSVVSFVFLLAAAPVRADRGAIPFQPAVTIFEPTQRALIAWNGQEEILILSTDLRASRATKVLEVMPFPAEPRVTKGDVAVFQRAIKLINSKVYPAPTLSATRGLKQDTAALAAPPPAEITFHERIGPHDVAITRVLNGEGFVDWVNNFLKRASVDNPVIPPRLRSVVQEYLDDEFRWFAFDVVSLEDTFKTLEALQYRFASPALFYPVKISRSNQGQTSMELLVLSPFLLRNFTGIPLSQVQLRHEPVSLASAELRSLDKGMDELLGHHDDMKLRIWHVQGDFSSFDRDIIAR
jgi:hypothetical protein